MSLQNLAQNVAAKGRGNDTMLVHMTPGEVGGLQTLAMAHGGSLSINPDTGLPEAGFLESLLPTLIGAGLTFFSGGAINPLTAGAIVGGVEGVRTGDLGKGIMAGLGAYTGGGLGGTLSGASSVGAQAATNQAAGQAIADATVGADGLSQVATNLGNTPSAVDFTSQSVLDQGKQSLAAINQPGGFSKFTESLGQQFPSTTGKAAATMGALGAFPQPKMPKPPKEDDGDYEGPYIPAERKVSFPGADRTSTSEFSFFSPTNPVPGYRPMYMADGGPVDPDYNVNIGVNSGFSDGFAVGGLTALAKGGRFLQGPGDGTSDSIPAVIGNRQPARLADGEFVVDARTVSELGNGSSKAGAKKLYKMMDRIHSARKKARRGQDSKAEKYLPA